jgi:DNA-binding response OmpR family regulator
MFSGSLSSMLREKGLQTDVAGNGADGLAQNEVYDYQVIILDLDLPDIDGQKLLSKIRSRDDKTPVIILSGHDAIEKQVQCIGDGADDFMTKPFHFQELIVRLHALVRRCNGFAKSTLNFGDVTLDLAANDVYVRG